MVLTLKSPRKSEKAMFVRDESLSFRGSVCETDVHVTSLLWAPYTRGGGFALPALVPSGPDRTEVSCVGRSNPRRRLRSLRRRKCL